MVDIALGWLVSSFELISKSLLFGWIIKRSKIKLEMGLLAKLLNVNPVIHGRH